MRKRFNLPAYTFCFGEPAVSDCTLWLCCCWCSLAQEVRTGNSYDIVEDKLCQKEMDSSNQMPHSPFSGKDGSNPSSPLGNNSSPSSDMITNSPSPSIISKGHVTPGKHLPMVKEETSRGGKDETMTPPAPSLIEREAN